MIEEITELINREPFEAFRIVLTSGDRIQIDNPNNLAVGASRIGYFAPKTDHWVMIRVNQIAALESVSKAA